MMLTFDIEILPNYALFSFMDEDGNIDNIEIKGKHSFLSPCQHKELVQLLRSGTIITFNGIKYDFPITSGALASLDCKDLYEMSQRIIVDKVPYWKLYIGRIKELTQVEHIDIMEPMPGVRVGLKLYGARMGSKKLLDSVINWDKPVSKKQMKEIKKYCSNDLILTWDAYRNIEPAIKLRETMSKEYGINLRSKSDPQIAETVILNSLSDVNKPLIPKSVTYTAPKYIMFKSKELNLILYNMNDTEFEINQDNGSPVTPLWLKNCIVRLGETKFKIGIGGIHAEIEQLSLVPADDEMLIDIDVASMYPNIIVQNKMYTKHLGKNFLDVYSDILKRRTVAKDSGDKHTSDSLKLFSNGVFGKLGSKYSKLYAPDMLLNVTLTGQLTMLMLIEMLELVDISVAVSNTDSLSFICKKKEFKKVKKLVTKLEKKSGLTFDYEYPLEQHYRDINNYISKYDGYVKAKGAYKETDLMKNPQVPICYTAIREYINTGTPIKTTIDNCKDIVQFCSATQVTGGATYKGEFIGKVVRWYYSKDGVAMYRFKPNKQGTHGKVPLTDGCKPMMDLINHLPDDINYDWYYDYAIQQYNKLGATHYENE